MGSPLDLVESIRDKLTASESAIIARRVASEEIIRVLTENIFEDVIPKQVLDARELENGSREFFVQWMENVTNEGSWLKQKYLADDVIADYDNGLEYADGEEIIDERKVDGSKEFLVKWLDGCEPTWEPVSNISEDILGLWDASKHGKTYIPKAFRNI